MKNGGVAILGSASATGDNRALMAVEQALNSPLLNDSDISGAKWLLLNITSAAGVVTNYSVSAMDNCTGYTITQTAGLPSGSVFPAKI